MTELEEAQAKVSELSAKVKELEEAAKANETKMTELTEAKEKPVFLTTKDILRGFRNFDLLTIYKARVLSVIAAFKAVIRLFRSIGK